MQRRAHHRACESSRWWARRFARLCPPYEADAVTLLLEPVDEPAQQLHPDLILADLVLDAVLEIGVVVDLHHHDAAVGLLEVDAIEAVADRARRAHRDVDDLG